MAELLVLEFDGVDEAHYRKVNEALGLDAASGSGDWPRGLITHVGAVVDGGRFVVTEVWESQEAQAEFMNTRLGAALGAGGVTATPRVTWGHVVGNFSPGA